MQLGHMPQEDFPEALHEVVSKFLSGESDKWDSKALAASLRMTKKGIVGSN